MFLVFCLQSWAAVPEGHVPVASAPCEHEECGIVALPAQRHQDCIWVELGHGEILPVCLNVTAMNLDFILSPWWFQFSFPLYLSSPSLSHLSGSESVSIRSGARPRSPGVPDGRLSVRQQRELAVHAGRKTRAREGCSAGPATLPGPAAQHGDRWVKMDGLTHGYI